MLCKVRVSSSENGQPLIWMADGAVIPGVPLALFHPHDDHILPSKVIEQFFQFSATLGCNATFTTNHDDTSYQFEAIRISGFDGVEEWLHRHDMQIFELTAVGESFIEIRLGYLGRALHVLSCPWDFLGGYTSEQINQYLEEYEFADQVRDRNVYIRDLI